MHFKTTLFILAASIVSVYAVDDTTSDAVKYHDYGGSMRSYDRYPGYRNYYRGNRNYYRSHYKRGDSGNGGAETSEDDSAQQPDSACVDTEEGDAKYFMDPYYGNRHYWPRYPYGRRYWY